jgi:transcriptional regulator of acetoin/glycerol metabolism
MRETSGGKQGVLRRSRRALQQGDDLPVELRGMIRQSWMRSRQALAPVDRITVPYVALDASTERLLWAAEPVLDRFAQQLAGTRVSLVLADRSARVVGRWAGDSSALRRLSEVSVEEGFVLAEDLAGTNGVGTALEELSPVMIFGEEHYAESLQGLVCVGVPIRHPLTRRIEGVLDLACPTTQANGLLMPTALDLCAQIEREMSARSPERERVVFDEFVARSRLTSSALVALSEQYMVTNAAAADLLELRDQAALWEQAVQSLSGGQPTIRSMRLSEGATVTARCTPVMIGSHPVGALIEVVPAVPAPLRTQGQSAEAGGASRAARQLQRDLAEIVSKRVSRVVLEGEPGAGKLFVARRLHELLHMETAFTVHQAGLAQVHGGQPWLSELEALLATPDITVAVANVEVLDERTSRGLADVLSAAPASNGLVLVTRQTSGSETHRWPANVPGAVVHVPPLRQRRDDIPDLVYGALHVMGFDRRVGRRAMTALINYSWPGNFPQLHSALEEVIQICGQADMGFEHLSAELQAEVQGWRNLSRLESLERNAIAETLYEQGGNKIKAAQALGISRSTLYRRLREFGLEPTRTVF